MIRRLLLIALLVSSSAPALAEDPLDEVSGTEAWTPPPRRRAERSTRYSELQRRMMLEAEREEALEEFEQDRYRFARERSEYSWDRADFIRRRRDMPTPATLAGEHPPKSRPFGSKAPAPSPTRPEPVPAVAKDPLATAPSADEAPSAPPWGPDPAEAALPPWPSEEEARGPLISGRLFTHLFAPFTKQPFQDSIRQLSASLWLSGKASIGEVASAGFTLTGDAFQARVESSEHFRARIREAYFLFAKSGLELRVGQQVIPWGNADGYNPTDFLGARDYTFLASDDELRRLGSLTAQVSWTPDSGSSPFTLSLSWTPIAPRSRLLIPSSALPAGLIELEAASPAAKLSESAFAIKASYLGTGWDAALVGFHGYSHLSELALDSIGIEGASITQEFNRLDAVGAEASFSYDKWIFRFEGAWRATANPDGTSPLVEPSGLDAVVGIERPIGEHVRVHGQMLWRYYPSFQGPEAVTADDPMEAEIQRGLASANALLHNYQDQNRPASTLRLTFESADNELELSALAFVNWVGRDYLVRPSLLYRFAETGTVAVGIDYYGGPKDRPFGALHEYRSLFVETKWVF
ncbi:MAG TPA: hypothetical protein DFS52_28300 [Myxococcales bacterium]|nr:hypothetical protein [Myxococcales bacterium]